MSKDSYNICRISKTQASELLNKYHYLSNISKGFKSGFNYGLFINDDLVGVAIYTGLPVPELAKGMVGLPRDKQDGLFELSRLCLHPDIQSTEHNITSWFLSRTIKQLKKDTEVKIILSYADNEYHNGTIYAACNFEYYGLTAPKKDFYFYNETGDLIKLSRGSTKGLNGKWMDRSRKHRFVMCIDKTLKIKWCKQKWIRNADL